MRTRPGLAFAVSSTVQVLTGDLELLKVRLRHILQYLNTTKTLGLLYPYPRKRLDGVHRFWWFFFCTFMPTFTVRLHHTSLFQNVRHFIHWQSQHEQEIAESSAESELYALAFARKSVWNFRRLVRESFSTSVVKTIRCETYCGNCNAWWAWMENKIHLHLGEAAGQELINRTMVLTYVPTDRQLADPMTKPTSIHLSFRNWSWWVCPTVHFCNHLMLSCSPWGGVLPQLPS